jgi:hypothetical protein
MWCTRQYMAVHVNTRLYTSIHVCPRQYMSVHMYTSIHVCTRQYMWCSRQYMTVHVNTWLYSSIHDWTRQYMAVHVNTYLIEVANVLHELFLCVACVCLRGNYAWLNTSIHICVQQHWIITVCHHVSPSVTTCYMFEHVYSWTHVVPCWQKHV